MQLPHKKILKDSSEIIIRNASINDLVAINDIYNYYVQNSTCTYQVDLETVGNRTTWFEKHGNLYPIIVAESNKEVIGWACISKFKDREAYKPTVEDSIYIRNDKLFNGLGSIFLGELINLSKFHGYHSIIAGISYDQEPSIILHKKFGFTMVAQLKEVGYKFGKWLDVVYFQLLL